MRTAEADLAAIASGQAGTVRLGAFQSARMRLLPRALARLKSARPDLEVRLDEASYQDHLERLAAGALDLAFALLPVEGPFETRELLADPFVFLVADHWARATDQLPPLAALADLPLISWQRGPFSLETMLESHGHDSRVVLRSDDSATVQELVAAGIGAAVLPQLALALPDPRLVLHDASPLLPARRIGLVWHRDRAPVPIVTALKETIEAECQGLQGAPRSGVGVQV